MRFAIETQPSLIKNTPPPVTWNRQLQFTLLAAAGTLLAACEGFDGITTILSACMFPPYMVFMAGLAFAALSVVVFYGFNLVQVSKNLGVTLKENPKITRYVPHPNARNQSHH